MASGKPRLRVRWWSTRAKPRSSKGSAASFRSASAGDTLPAATSDRSLRRDSGFMGLQHQQREVVRLASAPLEPCDGAQNGLHETLGSRQPGSLEGLLEALHAELLVVPVHGLGD